MSLLDAVKVMARQPHHIGCGIGPYDPWSYAGPQWRQVRQEIMTALTGRKIPVAKCGVNSIRAEMLAQAGIDHNSGGCIAGRDALLREVCERIAKGSNAVFTLASQPAKAWQRGTFASTPERPHAAEPGPTVA